MRPLALEVEGFTAFRTRQEVPFEEFELFAITGPTGAGKTTILDAMIFALYGKVPRTGGKGTGDLVSHGIAEARVKLDFSVAGARYRVARRLPRTSAQSATLEKCTDGTWRNIVETGGVRAANTAIEELVRLDFTTFCRAVVLPQGHFDEFLRGEQKDRRGILVRLLGLKHFEEMGARARARSSALASKVEAIQGIIDETYGDATAEHLSAAKARLAAGKKVETGAELAREMAAGHTERAEAANRAAATLSEAAHRIEMLKGVVESDGASCEAAEKNEAEAGAARAAADKLVGDHRSTAAKTKQALEAAVAKHGTLERLAELRGDVQSLEKSASSIATSQGHLKQARADIAEASEGATELEKSITEASKRLGGAREVEARLKIAATDAKTRATHLATQRDQAARARAELDAATTALEARTNQAAHAAQVADSAVKACEQDEAAYAALRTDHGAAALASGLSLGDPCPVCRRPLSDHPEFPHDISDQLGAAKQAWTTARQAEKLAEAARSEADKACAVQTQAVTTRQTELDTLLADSSAPEALVEAASTAEAAAQKAAETQATAQAQTLTVSDALEALRRDLATKQARAEEIEKRISTLRGSVDAEQRSHDATATKLRSYFGKTQPKEVAKTLEMRRNDVQAATQTADAAARGLEAAETEYRQAADAQTQADSVIREISAALGRHAATAEAAREQLLGAVEKSELPHQILAVPTTTGLGASDAAAELTTWSEATLAVALSAASELTAQAEREREQTVAIARDREADETNPVASLTAAARDARDERIEANSSVTALKQRIKERKDLEHQTRDDKAKVTVLSELAAELRTDRFVQYVIDQTLALLAVGASKQLRRISSGRYSLVNHDGEWDVIDHVNADERRSVRTLSGGESFLASLALALALSRHVTELAGEGLGTSLEAVFIDEGFGTLDPETLDEVIDALERLREQELMVGVISHVPGLFERIRTGVEVHKDGNRSTIMTTAV